MVNDDALSALPQRRIDLGKESLQQLKVLFDESVVDVFGQQVGAEAAADPGLVAATRL